jgi:ABC-type Zn uptake system ZnuABC Zn-binding protein ZnuA
VDALAPAGRTQSEAAAWPAGYVDVSRTIPVLDMARGTSTAARAMSPVRQPHYWLDPEMVVASPDYFAKRSRDSTRKNATTYEANEKAFNDRLNAAERSWQAHLAKIKGQPVVAWHTSWRYFAEYNGMNIVGFMEPKPGVPPSPSHLAGLIQTMKQTGAKVIVMEPFYDRKMADFVASKTGAKVLILPPSVGGSKGTRRLHHLMTNDIHQLAAAL